MLEKRIESANEFHCFPMGMVCKPRVQNWALRWGRSFVQELPRLKLREEENLADILPLLLCGEQSAVLIFNRFIHSISERELENSMQKFCEIESDEYSHEFALQELLNKLPTSDNLHRLKRRSQRFYASLSSDISIAEQFTRISQLDSCVCRLMRQMENSSLGKHPSFNYLFSRIKKDEAKHVSISRKQAVDLGISREQIDFESKMVRKKLVKLLTPSADSFDKLEVDANQLFKQILKAEQ